MAAASEQAFLEESQQDFVVPSMSGYFRYLRGVFGPTVSDAAVRAALETSGGELFAAMQHIMREALSTSSPLVMSQIPGTASASAAVVAPTLQAHAEAADTIVFRWDVSAKAAEEEGLKLGAGDWIGLFIHNRQYSNKYSAYHRTKGQASGEGRFCGLCPGTYDLRFFLGGRGSQREVAKSAPVLLGVGVHLVAAFGRVGRNREIRVSWDSHEAKSTAKDWVGLYRAETRSNKQYIAYKYVDSFSSLVFAAPREPGFYSVRYFRTSSGYCFSGSTSVEVPNEDKLKVSACEKEDSVSVSWACVSAEPARGDWVGVFDSSAPDARRLGWAYTSAGRSPKGSDHGSVAIEVPASAKDGQTWEVRFFATALPKDRQVVMRIPFRKNPAAEEEADEASGAFAQLNNEIVLKILRFLDPPSVAKVGTTCKRLHVLAEMPELWHGIDPVQQLGAGIPMSEHFAAKLCAAPYLRSSCESLSLGEEVELSVATKLLSTFRNIRKLSLSTKRSADFKGLQDALASLLCLRELVLCGDAIDLLQGFCLEKSLVEALSFLPSADGSLGFLAGDRVFPRVTELSVSPIYCFSFPRGFEKAFPSLRKLVSGEIHPEVWDCCPFLEEVSTLRAGDLGCLVGKPCSRTLRSFSSELFTASHTQDIDCERLVFAAPNLVSVKLYDPAKIQFLSQLSGLTDLELRFSSWTADETTDIAELGEQAGKIRLRRLALGLETENSFTIRAAGLLISPCCSRLEELSLNSDVSDQTMSAIISNCLPTLRKLSCKEQLLRFLFEGGSL